LSHDHYQGGHYKFAMEVAPVEETFEVKGYENTKVSRVKWPMSVIRLSGKNKEEIINFFGKYDNKLTKIVAYPGMMLQKITTKEPDDQQLEVALTALKAVINEK
ncbi:DUF1385 domain-containing protein, partial [Romboutsia sp. 13368]|uniref:DUF1385 domain-containing protein n=1 Tax=Romboutsia sp. 13368 TaxID=2708053 RepID=UPI0025D41F37